MPLTDSQWSAETVDIIVRLMAGTITETEAANEWAAATGDWPTRSLSNAGLAEQLSRFKARVNGLILTDGPPDPGLGGPNSVAIDLTARIFYGPKLVSDAWPPGVAFAEGPPGPSVELRTTSTQVQWRVVGAASWINLIALADLAGADGREVELRANATHVQWRLGTGTWTDLIALSALKGADGREVQLQTSATHIQWRYAGDAGWTDLVALADITPDAVPGPAAWTPVFAIVADGERRVQRIIDWVGGGGTKPATGKYVGPLGLVDTAAEATDVRGAGGAGSGDMLAANNLSDLTDKAAARTNLSVYSKSEADATAATKADLVGGKVPTAQLPALAITDVFEVASQAAMLALTAERGDVAIRTDENKSYVLAAEPATTLANWKLLRTPTDVVLSVAGETGAITRAALMAALAYAIADIPGLQSALDARLAKSGGEMTGAVRLKGFSEKAGTYTTGALDASTGSLFDAAISVNVTVSLSNLPASPTTGETVTAVLRATISGTPVITWPSGLVWAGATGPTLAAGYWEFAISARWTGSAWAYTGAWAKFF